MVEVKDFFFFFFFSFLCFTFFFFLIPVSGIPPLLFLGSVLSSGLPRFMGFFVVLYGGRVRARRSPAFFYSTPEAYCGRSGSGGSLNDGVPA